ncbi:MAG: hypothetical protein RIS47_514 [Bacteroidota bacterium]|jgi:membrane protease YdiL (CAAX protease family)
MATVVVVSALTGADGSISLSDQIVIAGAELGLVLWVSRTFLRRFEDKELDDIGFQLHGTKFWIGIVIGAALQFFGFVVLWSTHNVSVSFTAFNAANFIGYLALFGLVALHEEILIRGYILSNFIQSYGKRLGLLSSALLFGFMHFQNPSFNILAFINISIAGILLGVSYLYDQNLSLPIGMHWSWNFVQGPVLGFAVSGQGNASFIQIKNLGPVWITGGEFGFEGSVVCTVGMLISIGCVMVLYRRFWPGLRPPQASGRVW